MKNKKNAETQRRKGAEENNQKKVPFFWSALFFALKEQKKLFFAPLCLSVSALNSNLKLKKVRYITLLEVMIVIGILAFVGSITVFSIRKMSSEQSALNEMDKAVNQLRTAMDLMMMAGLDSEVRFSKKDNKLQMEMLPKSGISPQVAQLIPKKPLVLENINQVTFVDGVQKTQITDQIMLHFFSKGFIMNRGVLTFTSGTAKGSVIFYGYPSVLTLMTGTPPEYPADGPVLDLVQKVTEQTRAETIPSEVP